MRPDSETIDRKYNPVVHAEPCPQPPCHPVGRTKGMTTATLSALDVPMLTGRSTRERRDRANAHGRRILVATAGIQAALLADLIRQPAEPLATTGLRGPGVYLLTYTGDDPRLYGVAADRRALYVGSGRIHERLPDHRRSLETFGIADDITVRGLEYATMTDALVAERLLIDALDPDLDGTGFGNRAVGARRATQTTSTVDLVLGRRHGAGNGAPVSPATLDEAARLAHRLRRRRIAVRWP